MLVSINPCGPNAKPDRSHAKPGKPNVKPGQPNASRWNIGRVGSPCVGARDGHVDIMLYV